MIKSIELENFKAFKNSGKVNLKKINIFVGPNSGGKSSFIKGILTLKNTMDSKYSDSVIDMNNQIGDYTSMVYNHNTNNSIGFSFEFNEEENKRNNSNIDYILFRIADVISKKSSLDIKDVLDKLVKENENYLINKIKFYFKKNFDERIVVSKFSVDYKNNKSLELILEEDEYFIRIGEILIKIPGLIIPEKFYFRINEEYLIEAEIDELRYISIIYSTFESIKNKLKKFTDSIIHIEPFRDKPERVEYITRLSSLNTVGSTGGNIISTLINSVDDVKDKINFWLKEFDLAKSIEIKSFGNSTYSLLIKDKQTGIINNLLDVGVGTSQILPIIIKALNSKNNSTLIIEEPEVHIHPNAQSKLADLFVQCSKDGNKKFIIETHSIFLITQIEILVAQGKISADDVGVYYFQHSNEGATVKDMRLTSNGQFEEEWPSGFFDVNYNLGKMLFKFM
ncbi:DUF3696 domain-containing protein [Clostridium sp. JNZ J1-5]